MCRTCRDAVYLADDRLCPACVCAACRARQARIANYTLPEEFDDDPHNCWAVACGWARMMGTAAV